MDSALLIRQNWGIIQPDGYYVSPVTQADLQIKETLDKGLVKISKVLSLLLRHRHDKIGFKVERRMVVYGLSGIKSKTPNIIDVWRLRIGSGNRDIQG